ncbi:hypothetical protein BH10ACI2_BH10ACI2_07220 [soil metagenome]
MIEVEDLSESEIIDFLAELDYGHLACCRNNKPYVVPVHYAFDRKDIFVYTTEGKKADIIKENPNVCLQVEKVDDNHHWKSVIVDGFATQLKAGADRDRALELIVAVNPTLTPAVSIRWMDEWVRENVEVVYAVKPESMTGRRSLDRTGNIPFATGIEKKNDRIY